MDQRTEWPWSLEEEAEWKAELEEKDDDFVQDLIDQIRAGTAESGQVFGPPQQGPGEGAIPEKYLVTA